MAVNPTAGQNAQGTVLLLADRRNSNFKKTLGKAGFRVVESFTTDHAVAVCANNRIDAVVLNQNWFLETEGWSVARSLKAVKPSTRVLLILETHRVSPELPDGVDAMITVGHPAEVVSQLEKLISFAQPPVRVKAVGPKGNKVLHSKNPVPLKDWIKGIDSPE